MKRWLGLDLRSLALFRVSIGVLLLLDILFRSFHFRAHYTSQGILPLRLYLTQPDLSFRYWSVFYLNDSPLFVGLLFLVAGLAAMSLTVGYRTRLAGWVCWVFLLGIHHRNPIVMHKGDSYLLLLLFWGCLLPWGDAFSVDAQKRPKKLDPHLSVACAGYIFQICYLYWFSAVYRTHPIWAVDGSALYYTLHLDSDLTWLAPSMLPMESALMALSFGTLFFEVLGPFLLLLPFAWARIASVLLIFAFHGGIMVTVNLGLFAWICMAGPLGVLPAELWETSPGRRLEQSLNRLAHRLSQRLIEPGWTLPQAGPRLKPLVPALALAAISYYNFGDLYKMDMGRLEMNLIRTTGLDQRWGMFSPRPPSQYGWYSAPASTESGKKVELMPSDWGPIGQRWRFYRSNLQGYGHVSHRRSYLAFLAGLWDRAHPDDPIKSAHYIRDSYDIEPDYQLGLRRRSVEAEYLP